MLTSTPVDQFPDAWTFDTSNISIIEELVLSYKTLYYNHIDESYLISFLLFAEIISMAQHI